MKLFSIETLPLFIAGMCSPEYSIYHALSLWHRVVEWTTLCVLNETYRLKCNLLLKLIRVKRKVLKWRPGTLETAQG